MISAEKAILESNSKGWRTLWKNDGTDYPELLRAFLAGDLPSVEFKKDYSTSVHQADALGRRFIFKHYYKLEPRPEKRLWHRLAGTFYSRIFRLTNAAVRRGCQSAQDIFLVTEQFQGPYSKEVWMIAEFIPGEQLAKCDPMGRREQVFRTAAHIHNCGLASNDLHPMNMIVTPEGEIKLIDVSINSPLIITQMKDIIRLRRHFGDEPPFAEILLNTPLRRFLYRVVRCRDWFRRTVRRLQGKGRDGRKIVKKG
jgi:tRNA A-37 threonylcarbamoyl transferase component Bud32